MVADRLLVGPTLPYPKAQPGLYSGACIAHDWVFVLVIVAVLISVYLLTLPAW